MLIQNAHPSREKHLCPHYTFFSWNAYAHTSGFSLLESADPRQTFREDVELYIAGFKLPMTGFLRYLFQTSERTKSTAREIQLSACERALILQLKSRESCFLTSR